jgi:hypothetical protein
LSRLSDLLDVSVTIVSGVIIAILIISEFLEYRSTTMVASMVVEKNRRDKMWIQMNITFPHIPCACGFGVERDDNECGVDVLMFLSDWGGRYGRCG